jgi:site-specific recombinase XerD
MSYVQQACDSITGFAQRYEKFSRELVVKQYAIGTISNYTSKVASICLHYKKLPELLSADEIQDYLCGFLKRVPVPGKSMFIHTVVGLRCYYKCMGFGQLSIALPSIRKDKKLPVVLSEEEMRRLLRLTTNLKEKALLSMMYSCGLRVSEVCNLELCDIDRSRLQVHIRQSKGRKDRYVPLACLEIKVLDKYEREYRPLKYLFNGSTAGSVLLARQVSDILKRNCIVSHISKKVVCHSLRHTYATHLLEMGENIVRISQLLGHSEVKTTMVYLHVARLGESRAFSPLDVLFSQKQG